MSAQCNGKSRCVKGRRVALQMAGATVRRYTPSSAFATPGLSTGLGLETQVTDLLFDLLAPIVVPDTW